MFLALSGFHYTLLTHPLNECEAHIRHRSITVESSLMLHLDDYMLDCVEFVLFELELTHHEVVILDNLAGCES